MKLSTASVTGDNALRMQTRFTRLRRYQQYLLSGTYPMNLTDNEKRCVREGAKQVCQIIVKHLLINSME
jgi:hypothetical protein